MQRCAWAGSEPIYQQYHDNEWGKPQRDGKKLFEFILLEGMQAGLSWITILKRRDAMRTILDNFNPEYLAALSDQDLQLLLTNPTMIRNRRKVEALRKNALAYTEHFSDAKAFSSWLWGFVDGTPIINHWNNIKEVPAETALSRSMSKELKRKGFSFVGPVICYAFMQASGLVNDHTVDCDWYQG